MAAVAGDVLVLTAASQNEVISPSLLCRFAIVCPQWGQTFLFSLSFQIYSPSAMDASACPGNEEHHPPDNDTNAAKRARKRVIHTVSLVSYLLQHFSMSDTSNSAYLATEPNGGAIDRSLAHNACRDRLHGVAYTKLLQPRILKHFTPRMRASRSRTRY